MSTFSSTFTQGGQTQLHQFRMIGQVVAATLKFALWVWIISFGVLLYKDHVWQELWWMLCYGKAYVRIEYLSMIPEGCFDSSYIVDILGKGAMMPDTHIVQGEGHYVYTLSLLYTWFKKSLQASVIAMGSLIIVSWFWVWRGQDKKQSKVLRGFDVVSPKALASQIHKQGASPYTLHNIPLPKDAEYQHMMVTGTTGSGKSNMIHHLLQQIREQGDQAIIVDTTGGILSRFYDENKDILLNPLDDRSQGWDLWAEITHDAVLEEMAMALVPDQKHSDPFWYMSTRQVLSACIRYLSITETPSYVNLVHMLMTMPLKQLKACLEYTPAAALIDPANDRTALSIRASMASALNFLRGLDDSKREHGLSLLEYVRREDPSWLFLSCLPDQREYLRPLFSAWLTLGIKGVMQRGEHGKRRTWIIIDELASLNRLPTLMTGLAEIRKYGGCFVLGFQDLSQLDELYGLPNTKTFSNLIGTKVLFRHGDTDLAQRVARYFGEQEKLEAQESISYGAHQMRDGVNLATQKQKHAVVSASDIMILENLECYLRLPGNLPVAKVKYDYMDLPLHQDAFIPKPQVFSTETNETEQEELLEDMGVKV